MILDTLLSIAELGAKKELYLQLDQYKNQKEPAAEQLREIESGIEEGTETKKHLSKLIELLQAEKPSEFLLANHLIYISSIFREVGASSPEEKETVGKYLKASQAFYKRAQNSVFHERERHRLKEKLSPEEQTDFDKRLFSNEGMLYCLEFYLALYKAIQDAPNEAEKRKLIESTDINLGFGSVPGLWYDVHHDETLNKFVYKILDDAARNVLLLSYYQLKEELEKVHISCDKQDHCGVAYHDTSVPQVEVYFKNFLQTLLTVYPQKGITHLASIFFQPYGNKPAISTIQL